MPYTYHGLSIGPLISTLQLTRRTAEIWAGSYLFSYVSRELLREFLGKYPRGSGVVVFSPSVDELDKHEELGVGLYSDHIFFRADEGIDITDESIADLKTQVVESLTAVLCDALQISSDADKADCQSYLQRYVYVAHAAIQGDALDIRKLSAALELAEFCQPFVRSSANDKDYIDRFLTQEIVKKSEFRAMEGIGEKEKIPAIDEIAFRASESPEDKRYRKNYIAIVSADGDGVGKTIEGLNDMDKVVALSGSLFAFAKQATQIVRDYGGFPVYCGGDDLLFFAPVVSPGSMTEGAQDLIALLGKLDETFREELKGHDVSLSFGVAVTYKKYPMNEALEHARNGLDRSKSALWSHDRKKNAVSLKLIKHSGQASEFCLPLWALKVVDAKSHQLFMAARSSELLHSIHWKIVSHGKLLEELLFAENQSESPQIYTRTERLHAWFDNNFDEDIHKERLPEDLRDELVGMLVSLLDLMPNRTDAKSYWQAVDAIFRYNEFLQAKEAR